MKMFAIGFVAGIVFVFALGYALAQPLTDVRPASDAKVSACYRVMT